jgi:quinol monooxygenase YgiN
MSKTSLIVRMKAKPGQRDEILAALMAALPAAEAEEGTLIYSFNADLADEDVVWVFELYADGAALDVHGKSAAVAELFGVVGPLLAESPDLRLCAVHGGKGV